LYASALPDAAVTAADSLRVRWKNVILTHQLLVASYQPALCKTRNM